MLSPENALLLSRASAAVGWRAWEFAAALVLFDLAPTSLTLVAAFGLADTLVQAVTGPALGSYVDRTERYRSAVTMYVVQHILVIVSCLAAAGAFLFEPESAARMGLAAVVILAGVLAGAGASGSTLSVEQTWVVAVCGTDSSALTSLNSKMRAVDLGALLLAPLAAAAVLEYAGSRAFVLAFAAFAALSFFPEALLLRLAGSALAARQAAATIGAATAAGEGLSSSSSGGGDAVASPADPEAEAKGAAAPAAVVIVEESAATGDAAGAAPSAPPPTALSLWASVCGPLALWARQASTALMLALALLYLTVLSFHGVMTAYLQAEGAGDVVISAFRGAGAVFGLLSTLLFPLLTRRLSLPTIAACALVFQLAFITLAALPLCLGLLPTRNAELNAFQGGVAVSRLGLWLADLAIMQFIQETTRPQVLGAVQGAERSVCALLELLSYVAALAFAQPAQFPVLMLGSLGAVGLAAAISVHFALASWRGGRWQALESKEGAAEQGGADKDSGGGGGSAGGGKAQASTSRGAAAAAEGDGEEEATPLVARPPSLRGASGVGSAAALQLAAEDIRPSATGADSEAVAATSATGSQ